MQRRNVNRLVAGTLVVAAVLGAAGCSGPSSVDKARLRALEETPLAQVEVPAGATEVKTFREVGDEYTTIHGVHGTTKSSVTRRFASGDLAGTARTLAAELQRAGWQVYAADCAPPGGPGNSSSVTAAKQFDGFVARAEVVVVHPDLVEPYADLRLSAPNSRSGPESEVRWSWDTFDEACARTFGIPAGPQPGCDRWCDRLAPTTTTTTTTTTDPRIAGRPRPGPPPRPGTTTAR